MTGTVNTWKELEGTGKWRRSLAEVKDEHRLNTLGAFFQAKIRKLSKRRKLVRGKLRSYVGYTGLYNDQMNARALIG